MDCEAALDDQPLLQGCVSKHSIVYGFFIPALVAAILSRSSLSWNWDAVVATIGGQDVCMVCKRAQAKALAREYLYTCCSGKHPNAVDKGHTETRWCKLPGIGCTPLVQIRIFEALCNYR